METGGYADLNWRIRKVDLPELDSGTRDDLLMALSEGRMTSDQVTDFVQKRRTADRPYERAGGQFWQTEERVSGRTIKVNGMRTYPELALETESVESYLMVAELREVLG